MIAPVHVALGSEAPPVVASIVFSNVLMVAGYETLIGRRQTSKALVFALALGFVGLILVTDVLAMPVSNDVQASHSGVLLRLMAALSWTFATLLSKKQEIAGGWRFNAQQMVVGTVVLVGFTLAWNGPTLWVPQASVDFLWLSIPASVVSFGLWFRALPQRTATEASAWLAVVPAFSALIAWAVLGADFTLLQSAGMLLIAIGLLLQSKMPSQA